jgi:hypothetical protein
VRLSKYHKDIIRSALNRALHDRASYADAYGGVGPEAEAAWALMARYETFHYQFFGEPSQFVKDADALHNAPTISIFELRKSKP